MVDVIPPISSLDNSRPLRGSVTPIASSPPSARWLERIVLGILLAMLFLDRARLCMDVLFRYTEEDQAVQWYGAREILRGAIHEPCFYGQPYNSCLEGYLAAPLVMLGVPFYIACPLVTTLLGVLPFLVLTSLAWKRGWFFAAGFSIFLAVVMPMRYGIVTGIPRGFVTGLAAAGVAIWVLFRRTDNPKAWAEARDYFLFGMLLVLAWALNPNSLVVLLPLGVYALGTRFRRWRFWVAGFLGAAVASVYPLLRYQFYYVWHDDYRFHYRDQTLRWSWDNFGKFLPHLDSSFGDFLPVEWHPAYVLLAIFLLLIVVLVWRRRYAGAMAGFSGVALVVTSFFCDRVQVSAEHVLLSYSRMFLGVPVLLVMLIVWLEMAKPVQTGWRWAYRTSFFALVVAAFFIVRNKNQHFDEQAAWEMRPFDSFAITPVDEIKRVTKKVQDALDATGTTLVLIPNWELRPYNYAIPCMTIGQSLYPGYERRTWRLHQECYPRYDRILVLGDAVPVDQLRKVDAKVRRISENPSLWVLNTQGRSVIKIAKLFGIQIRPFEIPPGSEAGKD